MRREDANAYIQTFALSLSGCLLIMERPRYAVDRPQDQTGRASILLKLFSLTVKTVIP